MTMRITSWEGAFDLLRVAASSNPALKRDALKRTLNFTLGVINLTSMQALTAFLLLLLLAGPGVAATQEDWLLAYAKQHAGKFSSELADLPKEVTVRSKPIIKWWQFAEFDQERGVLSKPNAGSVWREWVFERCKKAGSFIGTNALGVKASVQRLQCERLEVQDNEVSGIELRDVEFPITPSQYRALKAAGPVYELDFAVGLGTKQEVATDVVVVDNATVSRPEERVIRVLRVRGRINALRIYMPDGKTLLAQYKRE